MAWAGERQLVIGGAGLVIVGIIGALIAVAITYEVPTCSDRVQNQDETGVDCGGACARLCESEADMPRVLFARLLPQGERYDLIAHIENREASASSERAVFSIEGFSEEGEQVFRTVATTPILPTLITPLFVTNIAPYPPSVSRVFVTLESLEPFERAALQEAPSVISYTFTSVRNTPRLTARIVPSETSFNTVLVATVFEGDAVVAATKTVVPMLRAGEEAEVFFTWRDPFPTDGTRVTILPASPL